MSENQSLLIKNKVICDAQEIPNDELESILKQKENQKSLFFFRFYTSIFNTFSQGKGNKFKKWMINHIGNEPILFDEILSNKSEYQLTQYMNNKGYFQAKVDKRIETVNKKTKLYFVITSNASYQLNEIQYNCYDTAILSIIKRHLKNSKLIKGGNFDVQNLELERQRITKSLNRNGYYYFENLDITYEADSLIGNNKIDLNVTINPPIIENDSTKDKSNHKKYRIRNTFIILDYDYKEVLKNKSAFLTSLDTTSLIQQNTFLLYKGKPYVNPQVVLNCDYIKNNDYYNANDVEKTKLALAQNILFRQISIEFTDVTLNDSATEGQLDCYIEITPSTKQSYSFNLEGTNTGGDWGAQAKATYENKNLLHGAEIFNIKARYSFEQNSWLKTETTSKDFSSRVYGFDFSIISPKFLFPFVSNISSRRYGLRTFIKVGYSYQKIPSSYESPFRYLSFGYIYKNNRYLTQYFTPFEINGIQYNKDSTFKVYIDLHKVSKNYEDYYISSTNYTLIWQNKNAERLSNNHFFKFTIEATGNTLYAYSKITNREKDTVTGSYKMFNTTFAQYIRSDIDYRYNFVQAKEVSTVFRLFIGCAFPYGNNNYVPYLKQYFAGGSNSMRAWTSLGPGTYKDTNTYVINKSDIKLEANLEQRFPIFSFLNGAVFTDIGNIWSVSKINGISGTQFNSTFYKDLAVAVGIGLRPNFSFFVFRVDLAVKMRNPALDSSKRWLWAQRAFDRSQDMNLTIGIGYPF